MLLLFRRSSTPILDQVTGASSAYGLRRLRSAYTGSAIRVRRSSDNAETDIGFSGVGLDQAALLSHCGAGSGFISKWYDQSGNGSDAIQATAGTQPRIVNSGVVDTKGGKPAIYFAGANYVAVGSLTIAQPCSALTVASITNPSPAATQAITGSNSPWIHVSSLSGKARLYAGIGLAHTDNLPADTLAMVSGIFNGASSAIVSNRVKVSGNAGTNGFTNPVIGMANFAYMTGYVAEVLIYPSAMSDISRQIIEQNQRVYYGVSA